MHNTVAFIQFPFNESVASFHCHLDYNPIVYSDEDIVIRKEVAVAVVVPISLMSDWEVLMRKEMTRRYHSFL